MFRSGPVAVAGERSQSESIQPGLERMHYGTHNRGKTNQVELTDMSDIVKVYVVSLIIDGCSEL